MKNIVLLKIEKVGEGKYLANFPEDEQGISEVSGIIAHLMDDSVHVRTLIFEVVNHHNAHALGEIAKEFKETINEEVLKKGGKKVG